MEAIPSSANTLSSRSSTESIADSVLKTPSDLGHSSPLGNYIPAKNVLNMTSSHMESIPKRSHTLPTALRQPTQPPPHSTGHRKNFRSRTDSTVSISSTSSQVSLLRSTLMMVTRPHSFRSEATGSTPSLLTSRTSVSSLASTSPSSCILIPQRGKHYDLAPSLAADATTALSPNIGTSLAQFSPTPRASSTLLRFGVSNARSKSLARGTRRDLGRASTVAVGDDIGFLVNDPIARQKGVWSSKSQDLPCISRVLEPDIQYTPIGLQVPTGLGSTLIVPNLRDTRVIRPGQALPGTPRPDCMDETHLMNDEEVRHIEPALTARDKGKGKALDSPTQKPSSLTLSRVTLGESHNNLPTLESIESGSRLMRAKVLCSTCGETGPDFPRCGRCSEAWCSRDCRIHANTKTGGKHRCAPRVP